ncbi:vascular endothelial growth factor C isoform X2 [Frankliniella occidentalis]|uniref:Vascular endothelial growth factor C isoform X2 n=1 Tax=Frankliniella occidentalis TaxID=133901 RepID=A0A9C6X696_FRAOC|nr:vascular endothelial growth factor C isoform X2 [Frankliniella occidentalis]
MDLLRPAPARPAPRLAVLAAILLSCSAAVLACGPPGRSDRDRRDIVFPGEGVHDADDGDGEFNPFLRHLTLEQIERLNNLDTVDDVVRMLSNQSHDIETPVIARASFSQLAGRFGGEPQGQARGPDVREPTQPRCQPRLQLVPLKPDDHISHMYLPGCVEIERCSGCCYDDRRLSCQPTKTELVPLRVRKYSWTDKKTNKEIVHVEKHLECRCGCIKQAKDCNSLQEYNPKECSCKCGNEDERQKCKGFNNKRWDDVDCRCVCRAYPAEGCTTGLEFDLNTCSCTAKPQNRRRIPDNTYKLDKRRRRWQNKTSDP